ncbi:MAG: peptidyl-prolyl cis-trans isomerase, partial [Desulfovibrio sp.]|nr:peptidyl-prolyl cis-trans isomerase [Desulfovibrio sp.]
FADLANQHNSANAAEKDGEIGWIERGVTVEPFEQAAFALKPGSVSEPVETKFGLHLILVHEKREASTKPLAEVQAEALKLMTTELGQDKMNEVMESLLEDNVLGKDLSQSAKHFNLEAVMTEPLSVLELMAKLEFSREDVDFMLSGSPIDSPMQSGKTACVVRVNKIEPEKVKEYEDVRKQIEQTLLAEKALSKAREKAQNLRKELKNEVTEKEKKDLQIQTSNPVERQSVVDPFLPNQELSDACFAAAPKTWLEDVYTVEKKDGSRGVLLAFVKSVEVADQESWERIKAIMERGLERDTAENLRDFFIKELLRTAKITNVNLDKVDHMDM